MTCFCPEGEIRVAISQILLHVSFYLCSTVFSYSAKYPDPMRDRASHQVSNLANTVIYLTYRCCIFWRATVGRWQEIGGLRGKRWHFLSEFGSLFFLTSTSLIKKGSDWINRFSVKTQPYLSIHSPLVTAPWLWSYRSWMSQRWMLVTFTFGPRHKHQL